MFRLVLHICPSTVFTLFTVVTCTLTLYISSNGDLAPLLKIHQKLKLRLERPCQNYKNPKLEKNWFNID
jgi:hypothetical protein